MKPPYDGANGLHFDADRAYGHVERLCYPRLVGTRQERRAAREIRREFVDIGLACRRERFQVPRLALEVGNRLVFAAGASLLLLGGVIASSRPLVAAILWGSAAWLVNSPWRLGLFRGRRWLRCATTENLIAALPGSGAKGAARVVFMAHYDTKSQLLPTGVRVAAVAAASLLCLLLIGLGLLAYAGFPGPLHLVGARLPSFVAAGLVIGLMLNLTGNRSPGAVDNGSGVGTLLELARTWRPSAGEPVEVLWVATASEEIGLDGAREFLRRHRDWLLETPTLLINLESVGAGDFLRLVGEPRAMRLAKETADELGLSHAGLRLVGAGMDHEPFVERGLMAVSILGDVVRSSFAFHSPRDEMSLVDRGALGRAGLLASHLARAWAERHRPTGDGETSESPDREPLCVS